jgi:hypothetical protein
MPKRSIATNILSGNGSSTARELGHAPTGEAQLRAASVPAVRGSGALRRYHEIAMGLAFSDAVCVVVALMASYALRYPGQLVPAREAAIIALAPLMWIVVFYTFDLYAPQHLSAPEELRRVIGASGVGIVLLVVTSFWSEASFSRAWVGLTWVLVLVLELLPRRLWRAYEWRLRMDGRLALRTLVVGTSAEATRLVETLQVAASGSSTGACGRPGSAMSSSCWATRTRRPCWKATSTTSGRPGCIPTRPMGWSTPTAGCTASATSM